jgi:hypothetical protein
MLLVRLLVVVAAEVVAEGCLAFPLLFLALLPHRKLQRFNEYSWCPQLIRRILMQATETLSQPSELTWSGPTVVHILHACCASFPGFPRPSYHHAGFGGAGETSQTKVTQIEMGVNSAIYVEDALPLCSHLTVCDLHDVRRIDDSQQIIGSFI